MKKPGYFLKEAFGSLFKKPNTVNYPFVPVEMPDEFRGQMKFIPAKCVGCRLCEKDCPSAAIHIEKVGDKKFEATFDLDRCIYCSQCVDSCNKDAIVTTKRFELAQLNRSVLKVTFHVEDAATSAAGSSSPSTPAQPADPAAK